MNSLPPVRYAANGILSMEQDSSSHGGHAQQSQEQACPILAPGHMVALALCGETRACRAFMLGAKPGEFLIVKPSPAFASKILSSASASVQVRLEDDGTLYGFDAPVLTLVKQPTPLLFLAYPKTFVTRGLRMHPRIKCLIPVMMASGHVSCQGHMLDISLGGCRLDVRGSAAETLAKGAGVEIRLPVDGLKVVTLTGKIRSIQRESGSVYLGLAFDDALKEGQLPKRLVETISKAERYNEKNGQEQPKQPVPLSIHELRDAKACVWDAREVELKHLQAIDLMFTGCHLYDSSTILGVDSMETVIAEMPRHSSLRGGSPKPGMGIKARFEDNGSHYAFLTSVTRFVTTPRPLVFFSYPKKIEILMRRKSPRVRCLIPSRLANDFFSSSGYITDLSMGGCRVVANLENQELICNVMTGDHIDIALPLDGLLIENIPAKVTNLVRDDNTVSMGLAFALGHEQTERLGRFLSGLENALR